MLAVRDDLVPIDSRLQRAGACAVCGKPVDEGDGITALHRGRILRFRCAGCLERFRRDPERYLEGGAGAATDGCGESPASEWVV
jgi:YHS domain-containing protein